MSGNSILLDTNTVLYLLGGKMRFENLPAGTYHISFITELELLSYPLIGEDEKRIKSFVHAINVVDIPPDVKAHAIALRRKYRLKLPDALICATALSIDAIFVTNDKELKRVKELRLE